MLRMIQPNLVENYTVPLDLLAEPFTRCVSINRGRRNFCGIGGRALASLEESLTFKLLILRIGSDLFFQFKGTLRLAFVLFFCLRFFAQSLGLVDARESVYVLTCPHFDAT